MGKWILLKASQTAVMCVPGGLLFRYICLAGTDEASTDTCALAFAPCPTPEALKFIANNGRTA